MKLLFAIIDELGAPFAIILFLCMIALWAEIIPSIHFH